MVAVCQGKASGVPKGLFEKAHNLYKSNGVDVRSVDIRSRTKRWESRAFINCLHQDQR